MSKPNAGDCYTGGVLASRSTGLVLIVTLALLGGAACVSSRDAGKPFASDARRKLAVSRTTKVEAQTLLGPALATATDPDGRDRWTYEYTRVSAVRLNPFGRKVTVKQTPYERLVLTFRDGLLTECAYLAETYHTEDGLILPADRVQESCG